MQHNAMILVYIHNVAILITYVICVVTKFNDKVHSYGI